MAERSLPAVSVVTPSFNQGKYLERTMRSVLEQGYPNLEYIIIDGVSTDESVDIIKKYEKRLNYWVSEPDRGQAHAINKGFSRASGEIFAWLNSDDWYAPKAIMKAAEFLSAHPKADAVVGIGDVVNVSGDVVVHREPPMTITLETIFNWLSGGDFMQPSCFFRRSAWEKSGPLDEDIQIALDLDLWIRMAKQGCNFSTLAELLSVSLRHDGAKTVAFLELMHVDAALVVTRHGGERYVRGVLEDMARRLAWSEPNLNKILGHPLVRFLMPIFECLMKPAARRRDLMPRWTKTGTKR